jgi:hypothetical protein
MQECQVCYCGIIRWKNVEGNRVKVSPGHCANPAFQETCTGYHAIERFVLSVAPKLSHSCFVQCLLHSGFSELKIVEKKKHVFCLVKYMH